MIGFTEGKCRLCGKTDSLNEGICAAHSSDAAQGYLFGYADGTTEKQARIGALEKAGKRLIKMLVLNRHGVPEASRTTHDEFDKACEAWEAALQKDGG